MQPGRELSPPDRRTRRVLFAAGLAGAVLLAAALTSGEPGQRCIDLVLGVLLLLPLACDLALGARTLALWRRVLLSAGVLVLLLCLAEAAIRALDLRAFSVPSLVRDPVMGLVHEPGRGGLDAWGFRNASVPERADVVCIGDSQTFGLNIRRTDTWPHALGAQSGLAVYNLSVGGYGPVQYMALIERALSLRPRVVVVGFFLGNDLPDAVRFAGLERWAELRDPAQAYAVPDLPAGVSHARNLSMALAEQVLYRSRLLGSLVYDLKQELKLNPTLSDLYWSEGRPLDYARGNVGTLFTVTYRLRSLDLERPEVRDGLRITAVCLERMAAACREREAELVLLLIHTKESCYADLLAARGEPGAETLAPLARAEREASQRLGALAAERSIRVVDPAPELLAELSADTPLWPKGADGHLNPAGCAVLARVLARELAGALEQAPPGR